ncbi:MAG: 50S ribosomal protein L11 methyltransferase [Desulfomonilaceae bacterium]
MSESWTKVEIITWKQAEDSITGFISETINRGFHIEDLNPDIVKILLYLKDEEWVSFKSEVQTFLGGLNRFFPDIPLPEVTVSKLKYENWATAWKDNFKPVKIGSRLIIAPPWDIPKDPGNRIPVIIEPAEAFGTGTHETTQGCLSLMELALANVVSQSKGTSLLDIGCGSGIISIAAIKLGAYPVLAIDNDPVAVASAKKNLQLNDLEGVVEIRVEELHSITDSADMVIANLDFVTLTGNLETFAKIFRECLIVSGVIKPKWGSLIQSFQNSGLRVVNQIIGKEWGAGLFVRES